MPDTSLTTPNSLHIQGLEGLPTSIIPVPYVRLVQPSSKNTEISDGVEAKPGNFLFNDTKQEVESLSFVLLRAKHGQVQFERDGELVTTSKIAILGVTDNRKLFILSLSPTSFSNFGQLIAQLKEKDITASWLYEILATSEKKENEKGKFYVVKFGIKNKLEETELAEMEELAKNYTSVPERRESEEKEPF